MGLSDCLDFSASLIGESQSFINKIGRRKDFEIMKTQGLSNGKFSFGCGKAALGPLL